MRSDEALRQAVAAAALLVAWSAPCRAAAPFTLTHIVVPRSVAGGQYRCVVHYGGAPPQQNVIEMPAAWHLTATSDQGTTVEVPLTRAVLSVVTRNIELYFTDPPPGDPKQYVWQAAFTGQAPIVLVTSAGSGGSSGALAPANTKDDADLYVAGSFLAGRGTKPIYAFDVRLQYIREFTSPAWQAWDGGVRFTASGNQDAKPPVDTTRLDFDALGLSAALRRWGTSRRFPTLLDLQPVAAEFTREISLADAVTKGRLTVLAPPFLNGHAAFYPYAGGEFGVPIRKPATLFDRPVQFGDWHWIARGVFGAVAEYYVFQTPATPDDLHKFAVDVTFVDRLPIAAEPFVTVESVGGTRTKVARLRRNARPEVEGALVWNITPLFGAQLQYKYGSLPPLFELNEQQVSLALTFKAKTGTHPGFAF
jgi:hypothetical protein